MALVCWKARLQCYTPALGRQGGLEGDRGGRGEQLGVHHCLGPPNLRVIFN